VLELDARWRELTQELEQVQAELNEASRGRTGPPTPEEREALAALSERGRTLSDEQRAVETERDAALAAVPNLPDEDAPPQDTVLREVGESGRTGETTSSSPARASTWIRRPGSRARASPTSRATS